MLDGFAAMQRIHESPLTGEPCVVMLTADAQSVSLITTVGDAADDFRRFVRAAWREVHLTT